MRETLLSDVEAQPRHDPTGVFFFFILKLMKVANGDEDCMLGIIDCLYSLLCITNVKGRMVNFKVFSGQYLFELEKKKKECQVLYFLFYEIFKDTNTTK